MRDWQTGHRGRPVVSLRLQSHREGPVIAHSLEDFRVACDGAGDNFSLLIKSRAIEALPPDESVASHLKERLRLGVAPPRSREKEQIFLSGARDWKRRVLVSVEDAGGQYARLRAHFTLTVNIDSGGDRRRGLVVEVLLDGL